MESLLKKIQRTSTKLEELKSEASKQVARVVNIVQKTQYPNDSSTNSYDSSNPRKRILGNHLIPSTFKDVSIEGGILTAGGMYSGSYSYYEYETIEFPAEWVELSDACLGAAALLRWDEIQEQDALLQQQRDAAKTEAERAEFERLQKKFKG